jgi:GxxExxY protein
MGEGCTTEDVGRNEEGCLNLDLLEKTDLSDIQLGHDFKYREITEKIIGCAMKVHRELDCGFQEVIYQRALEVEFKSQNIAHAREFEIPIYYQGVDVGLRRVDFLVDNKISLELKALSKLEDIHLAQAINYLEAYNLEVVLLINFGSLRLEFKRLLNRRYKPHE